MLPKLLDLYIVKSVHYVHATVNSLRPIQFKLVYFYIARYE